MMLTAGKPLGWVAQQMGHSDLNMLGRTYARRIKSAAPDVGNKAVEMFGSCDAICDITKSKTDISATQRGQNIKVSN